MSRAKKENVLFTFSWTKNDFEKLFIKYFYRKPTEDEVKACLKKYFNEEEFAEACNRVFCNFTRSAMMLTIADKTSDIQGFPHWFALDDRIIHLNEEIRVLNSELTNIDKIFLYGDCNLSTSLPSIDKMIDALEKDGNTGWRAPTINELKCLYNMKSDMNITNSVVWSSDTMEFTYKKPDGKKVPYRERVTLNFDNGEVCHSTYLAEVILVHTNDNIKEN